MQARKIRLLYGLIAAIMFSVGCATAPSKVAHVVSGGEGTTVILIQNADGSKQVRAGLSGAISEVAVSPSGERLAYVTAGTAGALDQVFVADLDANNNMTGVIRNVSDELSTARSFSPKFLDADHLLYLSESQGERVLVLADLRTGGKQKISAISGSIDTVVRYNVNGKNALFFGLNKELRRYDLPTGPLRSVVANTGSAGGLAFEKMGIFDNAAVFSVQVTPTERAVSHMRLDGTDLKGVAAVPSYLILSISGLASDPTVPVHRFSLFDFTVVMRPQEKESPPAADLITLEGYEVTTQKSVQRHLVWVVRDMQNPNLVRAVYAARGLEDLRAGAYAGPVHLASTNDLLVWYDPTDKKIWSVVLDQIGGDPVDLSAGVTGVANRPFSISANTIGVVTDDGKLYLLSANRTSPPRLLGQSVQANSTRP